MRCDFEKNYLYHGNTNNDQQHHYYRSFTHLQLIIHLEISKLFAFLTIVLKVIQKIRKCDQHQTDLLTLWYSKNAKI